MRKPRIIIFVGLAILIAGGALLSDAQEKRDRSFESALGEEQFRRCGLDKLSYEEQEELLRGFAGGRMHSFTDESARNYLLEKGWREVRVIGAIRTDDPFDDYWLLVWDNYELYTLDPFSIETLPSPGVYWAKNILSSWDILYPDGEVVDFTEREIR